MLATGRYSVLRETGGSAGARLLLELPATPRPGEGTGLGLALVKRLVEVRQGKVFVRSTPGAGAAFHVQWPKQPVQPTAARGSDG